MINPMQLAFFSLILALLCAFIARSEDKPLPKWWVPVWGGASAILNLFALFFAVCAVLS